MHRAIRFLALPLALAALAGTALAKGGADKKPSMPAMKAALDGMTFEVTGTKPDGTPDHPDILVFGRGYFLSTECRPYHFSKEKYTAHAGAGGTLFECTAQSPTDGTMAWSGTVKNEAVTGQFTWTDKDGKTMTESFTGMLLP